jgi:hypothetical protein
LKTLLKPQDLLVLIKLHLWQEKSWRYSDLAVSVGMSASEVHAGLKRSATAKLYNPDAQQVLLPNLAEFLIHGLKYVYPVVPGTMVRGIPTAHAVSPLKEMIASNGEPYVWAASFGDLRGLAIEPLYPSVPLAVKTDPALHELLGLVDALRCGRVREQQLAAIVLAARFGL